MAEFITTHQDQVVGRCLEKVGDRDDAKKTAALNTGIPEFLEQLIRELGAAGTMTRQIRTAATVNGNSLFFQGFTATQVVHVYGSVCQSVTDLAVELNAEFTTQDFRTLNRVLDDAIAGAVAEYTRQQRKNADTTTAVRQQKRATRSTRRSPRSRSSRRATWPCTVARLTYCVEVWIDCVNWCELRSARA